MNPAILAPGASRVLLAHGGGGQLTDELLRESVLPRLANPILDPLLDSALLDVPEGHRVALTMDGYVVQPISFPGADIGRLAVCGTVNDLAVCGARPVAIALGLILCEGLRRVDLDRVLDSIAATAEEADVQVVTGDTKVVDHGHGDGLTITTAGIGWAPRDRALAPSRVRPGDVILVNGHLADHGLTVMLAREMPEVSGPLRSDAAPLGSLIGHLLDSVGPDVAFLRDATRGGVAGVVDDLARGSGHRVVLEEDRLPAREEARHAADMLGLDILDVANEGKVVAVVRPEAADAALAAMRHHPRGRDACVIGHVAAAGDSHGARAEMVTSIGGRRLLRKPYGEQLPRIC